MTRFFADSNVLLYAIGPRDDKWEKANALILDGPVISVQVLNEFVSVSARKFMMPVDAILLALAPIRLACEVVPLTLEIHERAMEFVRTTHINIYDANIVAAAELAGCNVLYTEDLNHSQKIGRVSIVNPFDGA